MRNFSFHFTEFAIDSDVSSLPETYFDVRDESTPDGGLPELQERQLADVPPALGHLDRGEVDIADLERREGLCRPKDL